MHASYHQQKGPRIGIFTFWHVQKNVVISLSFLWNGPSYNFTSQGQKFPHVRLIRHNAFREQLHTFSSSFFFKKKPSDRN
jgi:hypothetical protein